MYCRNCGNKLDNNVRFCNKCGTPLYNDNLQTNIKKNNIRNILIGCGIGLFVLILTAAIIFKTNNHNYYFDTNEQNNTSNTTPNVVSNNTGSRDKTVVISDNTYSGMSIKTIDDATNLIIKDSNEQKSLCPEEIKKVEEEIIEKYNITAVNLCEMDVDFARELGKVYEKIYQEFPGARGYITNMTLVNMPISQKGVIAAYRPVFPFATSNTSSTYPWVIKTRVELSSSYFLNKDRLESSMTSSSSSGHFPPNSTLYSPIAHELGHYISYLAMMKHYSINSILLIDSNNIETLRQLVDDFASGKHSLSMIQEAYNNYKKDTNTTMSIDDWRGTISGYALAKNNSGEYIYDETIAEAFHDVYLNGENAKDASKYIFAVLKDRIGS